MEVSSSPSWLKQPIDDSDENACRGPREDLMMFSEVSRPVTLSMKLLGLWHDRSPTEVCDQVNNAEPVQTSPASGIWNIMNRLAVFYHSFITLVLWFDFIRFLVVIAPMITLEYASYLCWFFQTAATNTVLFLACYRSCKMRRFYRYWQNSSVEKHRLDCNQKQANTPGCTLQRKRFQKVGILAALGGWSFVLGSYPVSLYFTFGFKGKLGFRLMCWPWTNDIACAFLQIIHFFALACHKFPIVYLCLICYVLSERFDALTKSFEKENPLGTLAKAEVLEATRRQHNILCLLTSHCDYIFSTVVAIAFATNIPLLILLMYDLYLNSNSANAFEIAASCYWGISNLLNILLLSIFCSLLNEKAHSLRRHVFELHVDSSDIKTSHIAGFVLTYFTLLVDLGPDTSDTSCTNVTSDVIS
eukprot:XP_011667753.1 PREDICTED: uncharacterized protein LOC105439903 isoform X2 [Strongylocentrotus purpuratus]